MYSERDKARFWIKVKQTDRCWEWTGAKNKYGYGVFRIVGESLAHRISYQIINGATPANMCICHHCDNPICVNPDHLFLTDHLGNMIDKAKKGGARHFGRSSKYWGVSWRNDSKRWRSYIIVNRKLIHLSCHKDEIEAAKHYDRIAFNDYGIKDRLNFPQHWMPLPEAPSE